ncbi:MAG: PIG-L family deacetylase [Flavobacteriales bacterium]|nr:PIG-L family deacetylase [Flavobacteriales bacterium]
MRILYVFPHPDDESFGPVTAMHHQLQQGHEVHLLTLTKGGATKIRFNLGLSVDEMGELRYKEMLDVQQTVGLTGMTVLDMPDSGLSEMDPREIETAIREEIVRLKPEIVVTYAVHGISGFHDHLVCHAVVKRLYLDMKDAGADYLKRLAFFTIPDRGGATFSSAGIRLKHSSEENIDCMITASDENRQMMNKALDCYVSYKETIAASGVKQSVGNHIYFEIFGENHKPPLSDITQKL